jgi:Fibronectin type III domain
VAALGCVLAGITAATAGVTLARMSVSENGGADSFAAATLSDPTGFGASAASSTSANLSWTAPSTLTGYALSQSAGTLAGCSATPSSATTSCTATGLSPATTYTWTLQTAYDNWRSAGVQASTETLLGATSAGSSSFSCSAIEGELGTACDGPSISSATGSKLVIFANVQATAALGSLSASVGGPVSSVTSLDSASSTSGLDTDDLFAWSATATGSGTVTITLTGVAVTTTTWLEVVQLGAGESALTCSATCTATGTGTAVTVQITSVAHSTDSELAFLGSANSATFTAPGAFTTLAGGGSNSYGSYSQLVVQPTVSPAFAASSSSASWASIAVEIDP